MTPRTKKHLITEYSTFLTTRGLSLDVKVGYLLHAARLDPALRAVSELPLANGAHELREFLKEYSKVGNKPVVPSEAA